MKLVDAYSVSNSSKILYSLFKESVHEKNMPSEDGHNRYIGSRPYKELLLIVNDAEYVVGCIFLTKSNDIGVFVFQSVRRKGYGTFAVNALVARHAGEVLHGRVHPGEKIAIAFLASVGFKVSEIVMQREGDAVRES